MQKDAELKINQILDSATKEINEVHNALELDDQGGLKPDEE